MFHNFQHACSNICLVTNNRNKIDKDRLIKTELDAEHASRLVPDQISYSVAAINACEKSASLEHEDVRAAVVPVETTDAAAISACEKAWPVEGCFEDELDAEPAVVVPAGNYFQCCHQCLC